MHKYTCTLDITWVQLFFPHPPNHQCVPVGGCITLVENACSNILESAREIGLGWIIFVILTTPFKMQPLRAKKFCPLTSICCSHTVSQAMF